VYVKEMLSPETTFTAANTLLSHSVPEVEALNTPCSVMARVDT